MDEFLYSLGCFTLMSSSPNMKSSKSGGDSGAKVSTKIRVFSRGIVAAGIALSVVAAMVWLAFRDDDEKVIFERTGLVQADGLFEPIVIRPWARLDSVPNADLKGVAFPTESLGIAVGEGGLILRTTNGGETWQSVRSGTNLILDRVAFWDAENGIASGISGAFLATGDGGETWSPVSVEDGGPQQTTYTESAYGQKVAEPEQNVANANVVQQSVSELLGEGGGLPILDIALLPDGNAVMSSVFGEAVLWHTDDFGQSWSRLPGPKGASELEALATIEDGTVFAVEEGATELFMSAPVYDEDWRPLRINSETGRLAGRLRLFATDYATILIAEDGYVGYLNGGEIEEGRPKGDPKLHGIDGFVDEERIDNIKNSRRFWIVGDRSTVLTSTDNGLNWSPVEFPFERRLEAVRALDVHTAIVTGEKGSIYRVSENRIVPLTRNSLEGEEFSSDSRYIELPGPWAWILSAFLGALVFSRSSVRRVTVDTKDRIAELFVSDRPLEEGDPDWLGFDFYVSGITRYLKNENTTTPLTLGVCGEWGSGKSSMMNLIRRRLEKDGYSPVWFNAWHHRQEDNLLAFLLQTIREEGIPPWHSLIGIRYRLNLAKIRFFSRPSLTVFGVFLFCLALSIGIKTDFRLFEFLQVLFTEATSEEVNATQQARNESMLEAIIVASSSGGVVLAPLYWLWTVFKSFGVNPATLISEKMSGKSMKTMDARTRFRQQFAADFKEVTDALGNAPLVVFIDDLDRCDPDSAMQILEAVNYLASSGECFIVIGMDEVRVKSCVAASSGYLEVETFEQSLIENELERARIERGKRLEFAERYLEKLIQIKVHVPKPNEKSAAHLASKTRSELPIGDSKLSWVDRSKAFLDEKRREVLIVVAMVLFAGLGSLLGVDWGEQANLHLRDGERPSVTQKTESTTVAEERSDSGEAEGIQNTNTRADAAQQPTLTQSIETEVAAANGLEIRWIGWLGTGIILVFYIWLSLKKIDKRLVVHDSETFVNAAEKWSRLLYHVGATPRIFKRFLNRVRFYAMLQREEDEGDNTDNQIAEDILVAYGAIEQSHPEWPRLEASELKKALEASDAPMSDEVIETMHKLRTQPESARFFSFVQSVQMD